MSQSAGDDDTPSYVHLLLCLRTWRAAPQTVSCFALLAVGCDVPSAPLIASSSCVSAVIAVAVEHGVFGDAYP